MRYERMPCKIRYRISTSVKNPNSPKRCIIMQDVPDDPNRSDMITAKTVYSSSPNWNVGVTRNMTKTVWFKAFKCFDKVAKKEIIASMLQ